jgi:hypothetical protein
VAGGTCRSLGHRGAGGARAIIDVPRAVELSAGYRKVDPVSRHCHVVCRFEACRGGAHVLDRTSPGLAYQA